MGCPSGTCTGYELRANLDFDTDGDGATYTTSSTDAVTGDSGDTYYNSGAGWTPIGGHAEPGDDNATDNDFSATFEGNDHTVSNLYINLSTTGANGGNYAGLFADLAATGAIRNVGLVNPYVSNRRGGAGFGRTGALAGRNNGGAVSGSYVSGGSVASNQNAVTGLVHAMAGCLLGYNGGTVSDSYATCAATATGADDAVDIAGGLVGWSAGTVRDSYATGTVAGDAKAGGLVGFSNISGRVSGSHATGAVSTSGGGGHAGGLVGHSAGASAVTGSYATGAVSASGSGSYAGGLAGRLSVGGTGGKTVRASYAAGAVSASGSGSFVGGLTGQIQHNFSIVASYATGAVSASGGGTNHLGGLVGNLWEGGGGASVTNSYWDTSTSGQTASAAGLGKTTSELQSPMGYTGIYAGWNLNLDGQAGNDDPWYFGVANQYPVLQYGGNDLHIQLAGDYDWDDDGLIEVSGLAQLYAVRWDLDGNGVVDTGTSAASTAAGTAQYDAAFPGAIAHMGCRRDHDANTATDKVDGCIGYELTRDLDFDTDGDGATYTISSTGVVTGDAGDAYYNGGKGWKPIGGPSHHFTATFDGNGKTIANLFINDTAMGEVGLFGRVTDGRVERLGVLDVNVTGPFAATGSLVGINSSGTISASYATGSVTGNGSSAKVGGLVGENSGTISASYATGSVTSQSAVGGLVGENHGTISASYATGSVTGTRGFVGGLAAWNSGTISASYATGSVSGSYAVGGLVGTNGWGIINTSYATGSVTGVSAVGGLVGLNEWRHSSRPKPIIISSYATGAVKGTGSNVGGLVGSDGSGPYRGTATASYWDTGTTGQSTSTGGAGKTTSELQSPTGYAGIYANWNANLDGMAGNDDPWDFGSNRQYPALKYGGLDPFLQRPVSVSVQSVNQNIPIVGGPVTATLDTPGLTGITWQWQSSSDGSAWTNIADATSTTYIPVAADAAGGGKSLRVIVSFTASGSIQTLTSGSTAKVVSNTTAPVLAAASAPIVGEKLRYYLSAAGATHRTAWQWRRCDDVLMRTHCKPIIQSNSASDAHTEYTPVAGTDTDVGKYLQAYAYYAVNDAGKTWTRAESPVLGPVVAAPAPATSP